MNQARIYMVYGLMICALFAYACSRGWKVVDPFPITPNKSAMSGPNHK